MPAPILPFTNRPLAHTGNFPDGNVIYAIYSETFMNTIPSILFGAGYDCATAKPIALASIAGIADNLVQNGYSFGVPTAPELAMTLVGGGYTFQGPGFYGEVSNTTAGYADGTTFPWPLIVGDTADLYSLFQSGNPILGWVEFNRTLPLLDMTNFDFETWWCYWSGCCTPPIGSGPKFLIPRPLIPQPGEENVSTPVLNKAIYLSNYTFQFVNNFGRVKKQ